MYNPKKSGLEQRAEQRREDRKKLASVRTTQSIRLRKLRSTTRSECKDRHRATVYLTTLPTKQLIAVYKAALAQFEKP